MAPLNVDAKYSLIKKIIDELPNDHRSKDFYISLHDCMQIKASDNKAGD